EFVGRTLGPEAMQRAVVVAAPADAPPLMRLHGAWQATAIAEYFRDTGKRVLLLMDSLTRFAQAQREIGLAIGEPPATRGYPPKATTGTIRWWIRRAPFSMATSCSHGASPSPASIPPSTSKPPSAA